MNLKKYVELADGDYIRFEGDAYHKIDFTNRPHVFTGRFVGLSQSNVHSGNTVENFSVSISDDFSTASFVHPTNSQLDLIDVPLSVLLDPVNEALTVDELASKDLMNFGEVFEFDANNNLYLEDDRTGCNALVELHQESVQKIVGFSLSILESNCTYIKEHETMLDDSGILIYIVADNGELYLEAHLNLSTENLVVSAYAPAQ